MIYTVVEKSEVSAEACVLLRKPGSNAFSWGVGGSPGAARPAALGPSQPGVCVLCAGFGVSAVQLTLGSCILSFWVPRPQAPVRLGALGLRVQLRKLGVKADGQHGRALHLFWVWGTHGGRGCWVACWALSSAEPVPPGHPGLGLPIKSPDP